MDALPEIVTEHLDEVRALCEKYSVRKLTIDPEKSDLDFVVEFEWYPDPSERGRRWLELWDELKDLFGRNIDLLVASTIENPQSMEDTHVDLYAA